MRSIQDPLHDTLQGTVQSPLHDLLGGSAQGSVQGPLHGRHWSRPHAWPTERLSTRLDLTPSARPASGTGPRALCTTRCEAPICTATARLGALRGSAHGSLQDPLLAARHWSKALCTTRCEATLSAAHCEAHCGARRMARLKVSSRCKAVSKTPSTAHADVQRQASSKPPLRAQRLAKLSARP